MKVAVVVVAAVVAAAGVAECALQVQTAGGRIQGKVESSVKDKKFHSYYSIPYARPPTGAYRFKEPQPFPAWVRLMETTSMPPPCLQYPFPVPLQGLKMTPEELLGSEDCLYLNVFTPVTGSTPEREKLPVMVWIHGGGYFAGAANEYLPHVLLDQDIVLVVIQYRLGVLGFLSTEDSVIPGNFGLKDQTLALQWVQRNIHHFGGDKSRVTIFGESAGGTSVHYQMLTPKAEGLFSRVIMQSGTAVAPWSVIDNYQEVAEQVGRSAGCEDVQNSTSLLACLQEADGRKIVAISQDFFKWFMLPIVFAPRVDGDYIPDHPAKLLRDGRYNKVDLMAGVTSHEGAMISKAMYCVPGMLRKLKDNFPELGPVSLLLDHEEDPATLTQRMYEHYLRGGDLDEAHSEEVTKLYTDHFFTVGHDEVTKLHHRHSGDHNTFRYQFDYRGETSVGEMFTSDIGKHWVSHGEDLLYLFSGGPLLDSVAGPEGLKSPRDLRMRDIMTRLWTNFAATGNPTADSTLGFTWKPSTEENLHFLSLKPEPTMEADDRQEVRELFASLDTTTSRILYPERPQQRSSPRGTAQEEL